MSPSTKWTLIVVSFCSLAVCCHSLDNAFSSIFRAISSIAPVSINNFNGTATSLECPDMYKATNCLENEVAFTLGQIHSTTNFTELHESFCQSSEVLINCTASYLRECPPMYTMTFEMYFGALQLLCSPLGYNDVVDSFTCFNHPSLALQLDQCEQALAARANDTYLCSLPDGYVDCFSEATSKICSLQANLHLTSALHRVFLPYKDAVCGDVNITSIFEAIDANGTAHAQSPDIYSTNATVLISSSYDNATANESAITITNEAVSNVSVKLDSTTSNSTAPSSPSSSSSSFTAVSSATPTEKYNATSPKNATEQPAAPLANSTIIDSTNVQPQGNFGANITTITANTTTAPKVAVGSYNTTTLSAANASTSTDATAAPVEALGSANTTTYSTAAITTASTSTTASPTTPVPSPPFQCYECGSGAPGYWQNSACPANGTLRDWAKQTTRCNGPCVVTVTRWPLGDVVRGCSKNQIYQFAAPSSGCRKNYDDIVCFCSGNGCNDRDMTAEQAELVKLFKPQN